MILADYDFYDFEPAEFMASDLAAYDDNGLREMAYFIWTMFPDDLALLLWRKDVLLPLVKPEDSVHADCEEWNIGRF